MDTFLPPPAWRCSHGPVFWGWQSLGRPSPEALGFWAALPGPPWGPLVVGDLQTDVHNVTKWFISLSSELTRSLTNTLSWAKSSHHLRLGYKNQWGCGGEQIKKRVKLSLVLSVLAPFQRLRSKVSRLIYAQSPIDILICTTPPVKTLYS